MKRLNLLVLRCADIHRSAAFYQQFGFSFALHRHGAGPEHLACEDSTGVLELYPATPTAGPDTSGLGFAVADLSEVRQSLASAGSIPAEIKDNPWGRSFVVRDPDGRRVEVTQV